MITKEYPILAVEGMHARPATLLIKLVKNYKSVIQLKKNDNTIKLNSILNILSLSLKFNDIISVTIEGEDEAEAIIAIENFFINELKIL